MNARRLLAVALSVAAAAVACGGTTSSAATSRICTPGAYVYCRCQDRSEGTKLCQDDGASFAPCVCDGTQPPPTPPDPPPPPPGPDPDAGADAPPPAKCNNGVPEQGEACDDGNADDTDGCDTSCALAGADPPATRSCPGLDVHVWGTTPILYDGNTSTSAATGYTPTCTSGGGNPTTGAAASDRVFHVTTHVTGTLVVATSDTSYDNYVYASDQCNTGAVATPYLACVNATNGVGGETLEVPVQAGKSYSVFVDGAGISGNTGTFRVTFKMK